MAVNYSTGGYFSMACSVLTIERVDPIISPGLGPSGHVHAIAGGNAFSGIMTNDTPTTSTCTTCPAQADNSNYWVPALYFYHNNGSFILAQNHDFTVYYKYQDNTIPFTAFPDGFRMLTGSPSLRSFNATPVQQAITWKCVFPAGQTSPVSNNIPSIQCPDGLRAQMEFPSCGKQGVLYEPNNTHVTFPSDWMPGNDNGVGTTCPPEFPIKYPRIFLEYMFVNSDPDLPWQDAMNPTQPYVLSMGDPTGYGLHADFFAGWKGTALADALTQCTSEQISSFGDASLCPPIQAQTSSPGATCVKTGNSPDLSESSAKDEVVSGALPALPGNNPVTTASSKIKRDRLNLPTKELGYRHLAQKKRAHL